MNNETGVVANAMLEAAAMRMKGRLLRALADAYDPPAAIPLHAMSCGAQRAAEDAADYHGEARGKRGRA